MTDYKDPREEDIVYGDRRLSRPDNSLPDWEMPDTAYRPVPIVWFTGAFFLHLIVSGFLAMVVLWNSGTAWFAMSALAAGWIAKGAWDRGMKDAGAGWKIATILMLAVNLFFVAAIAFSA